MKNIKEEFSKKYLSPQGRITRYFDSFFIFMCSIVSIYIYYGINYELCSNNVCEKLVVTKYWFTSSYLFLIYSASVFVTGLFVLKTKELQRIYSISIALAIGTSFILCGMLFFAIMRELGSATI